MKRLLRAKVLYRVVVVCALIIGVGIGYFMVQITTEATTARDFASDLRDGLVDSCEKNGNPLREAVQHQLRKEIRQRETLDYSQFFPNVPQAELDRLIGEQNADDRATLREIAPVNCEQLYPSP